MKMCIAAVLAIALAYAFAGDQPGPGDFGGPQGQPAKGIKHRINFDEPDVINGVPAGPDITIIEAPTKIRVHNLIRIREDFSEKVLKSVNAL